jgi:uncharacterized BrkB/YihY/UPF0761 family membrane protein
MYTEDFLLAVLLLLGVFTHFLKRVVEEWKQGNKVTIRAYFINYPYHTALSITASLTGFFLLYGTADMTRVVAWALGYMGDSVAEVIGSRRVRDSLSGVQSVASSRPDNKDRTK